MNQEVAVNQRPLQHRWLRRRRKVRLNQGTAVAAAADQVVQVVLVVLLVDQAGRVNQLQLQLPLPLRLPRQLPLPPHPAHAPLR